MFSFCIRQLNRCDFFLGLWIIYYLQGIVYPEGSILSISILAFNLIVSVYYAIKVLELYSRPLYFKGLTLLLVLFSIYGFGLILANGSIFKYGLYGTRIPSYNYIKTILLSLLPIYPFYYFSIEGYLTEEKLKKWVLLFFISCTLSYYKEKQDELQRLMGIGSNQTEVTNNSGYLFLSLIPAMILYRRKPAIMFLGLLYILTFIILGMKRGAILIGGLATISFFYFVLKQESGIRRIKFVFLIIFAIVGVSFVIMNQLDTSEYALQRIEDTRAGNSSGRDAIYAYLWNYVTHDASTCQILFGRGAYGTLEVYDRLAHNDWLEIAVNQGILGICIYLYYWVCYYKTCRRNNNPTTRFVLLLIGLLYFMKTFFSMSYEDMTFVVTSVLGFSLANGYKNEPL